MIKPSSKQEDKRSKKDWRKPFRRSKVADRSCRNHGGCDYCKNNRTHGDKKSRTAAQEQLDEWTNFDA